MATAIDKAAAILYLVRDVPIVVREDTNHGSRPGQWDTIAVNLSPEGPSVPARADLNLSSPQQSWG